MEKNNYNIFTFLEASVSGEGADHGPGRIYDLGENGAYFSHCRSQYGDAHFDNQPDFQAIN